MPDDIRAPFRVQFDNARDPYTARNALGVDTVLSGSQPLDGDLTAIAALTGTNTIYYRSGTDTWSPVTIGSGLTFAGGSLAATAASSAWATWSPTITASSGTFTSITINIARYAEHGKTVVAHIDFVINTVGTAAGAMFFSLPQTASASGGGVVYGQEVNTTGVMLCGVISPSGTTGRLVSYNGTTAIAAGYRLLANAIYERG